MEENEVNESKSGGEEEKHEDRRVRKEREVDRRRQRVERGQRESVHERYASGVGIVR